MLPCVAKEAPEKHRARQKTYALVGHHAAAQARYALRNPEKIAAKNARTNASSRHRAHSLMVKYGMTLGQAEKMGVIPPDVQEALNGNR